MPFTIRTFAVFGIVIVLAVAVFTIVLAPSGMVPEGIRFQVNEGESLHSISERLEDEGIVRSALFFRGWISFLKRDTAISLGVYEFDEPKTLGSVVRKFIQGPDQPLISVTVPEGSTTKQIASLVKKVLPAISTDAFVEKVQEKELHGFLFPSTYYPLPSYTEDDMIRIMNMTFERQYSDNFSEEKSPKMLSSRKEVIVLASILEGEANTKDDMKIVAGILEKRLEKGMRLQVDVAEVTYRKSGLPEQPINNPGLVAIEAVLHPTETPYLYYLTGNDGRMYYAKTYEEHKKNIQKHLK